MYRCIDNPNNKYYRYAVGKEIQLESRGMIQAWPPAIDLHPLVTGYINQEITGEQNTEETGWYDIFIDKYKAVDTGLSLGTGTARQQKYLLNKGFVKKWDSIDLIIHKKEHIPLENGDISLQSGDLNFIELPEHKYPLIFCHGVLHHIINLEHLLFQVNKALTADGLFIVYEYVGETKQQWQQKKIELVNSQLYKKYGSTFPALNLKISRRPVLNKRPFESIRSADIPLLIKKMFGDATEYEYLGLPLLYPIINHLSRHNKKKLLEHPEILEEILTFSIQIDKDCPKNIKIQPTLLAGIYHKSKVKAPIPVQSWTKKEIKFNLASREPCYLGFKKYLSRVYHKKKVHP